MKWLPAFFLFCLPCSVNAQSPDALQWFNENHDSIKTQGVDAVIDELGDAECQFAQFYHFLIPPAGGPIAVEKTGGKSENTQDSVQWLRYPDLTFGYFPILGDTMLTISYFNTEYLSLLQDSLELPHGPLFTEMTFGSMSEFMHCEHDGTPYYLENSQYVKWYDGRALGEFIYMYKIGENGEPILAKVCIHN